MGGLITRLCPLLLLIALATAPAALADGGGLASRGCLTNEAGNGCTGVGAGSNALNSATSPDGKNVYVRAYDTIEIYSRGAGGALSFVGCLRAPGSTFGPGCT